MIVKSKLIQAIFASLLSVALLAPATYVSAQTETSSKVKKTKSP